MKRAAVAAAALLLLLVAARLGFEEHGRADEPPAAPAPSTPARAAALAAIGAPPAPAAPPVAAPAESAPLRKPAPLVTTPAPPPAPGADDPGPGPYIERYDGRSGRLSPNAAPGGGEVTTRVSSQGGLPLLTVWVPSIRIQAGAEVVIEATLTGEQGAQVAPASIVVAIAKRGEPPAPEQPLVATAQGYELRFEAPRTSSASTQPVFYDYVVQARGQWNGAPFVRTAVASFLVHSAGGRLDPARARLERRGGDLVLEVPAVLDRPGTYWMYAELWGGKGYDRPIAFARDRFEKLEPGARALAISFGGAVIRDSGIDGPYLVRNLRFQQVDAFPPQEAEPVAQLAPTAAFRAAEFN